MYSVDKCYFSVKTFRGFAERIEWDLAHPSNYEFNNNDILDYQYSKNSVGLLVAESLTVNHK